MTSKKPLVFDAQDANPTVILAPIKQPFMLVIGQARVGKTTMLRRFVQQSISDVPWYGPNRTIMFERFAFDQGMLIDTPGLPLSSQTMTWQQHMLLQRIGQVMHHPLLAKLIWVIRMSDDVGILQTITKIMSAHQLLVPILLAISYCDHVANEEHAKRSQLLWQQAVSSLTWPSGVTMLFYSSLQPMTEEQIVSQWQDYWLYKSLSKVGP